MPHVWNLWRQQLGKVPESVTLLPDWLLDLPSLEKLDLRWNARDPSSCEQRGYSAGVNQAASSAAASGLRVSCGHRTRSVQEHPVP